MHGLIPSPRRAVPGITSFLRPARLLVALAMLVLFGVVAVVLTLGARSYSTRAVPAFGHIWVVFMENRDYGQVIGSPDAPYVTRLARGHGLATQYFGVVHGSQPNYIGFFSGATYGVTGGSTPNLPGRNLADQLDAAHRSWHVYAQNYPGGCFNKTTASGGPDGPGTWVRRHTPALAFTDIRSDPMRCANITDFQEFDPAAADFELIVPNLTDSGHDGTTRQADDFLRSFVPKITSSNAWRDGGVLFVVWDEGTERGPNRVPLLVISPMVRAGTRIAERYNHYSLLATIESAWHLGCLGSACDANTLAAFFARNPGGSGSPS